MIQKLTLLVTILMTTISCSREMEHSINDTTERVKQYLDGVVKKEIPGIQYLVLNKEGPIFEYNGGWRDVKNDLPVTPNTTFMMNSSTKPIVALAILQLVQKGALSLDDSLSLYFQEHPYGDKVKIRHLLNQTSGISNPAPLNWFHLLEEHDTHNENKSLRAILVKNNELDFEPGEKYQYSNISYWLLGKVIEKISGGEYTAYIENNIFVPLGIKDEEMGFLIHNPTLQAKEYQKRFNLIHGVMRMILANKYIGGSEKSWKQINYVYHNGAAYGGLYGNARGIAKLLKDQLNGESNILSAEMKDHFYSQQKNSDNASIETTLGWHTGLLKNNRYFGKPGGGIGSHSNIRIYPKKGIATIFFVNQINISADSINEFSDFLDNEFLDSMYVYEVAN